MKLAPAELRVVVALAVGMFCVQVDFFAVNLAGIGSQTVGDPARAGEAAGGQPHGDGDNRRRRGRSQLEPSSSSGRVGTTDIVGATRGVLRLVSVLSIVGGAGLLAVSLIGRGSRRS
jgi:hypothetical protein